MAIGGYTVLHSVLPLCVFASARERYLKGQPRPQLQIGQVVRLGKAFSQNPHNLQLGVRLAFKVGHLCPCDRPPHVTPTPHPHAPVPHTTHTTIRVPYNMCRNLEWQVWQHIRFDIVGMPPFLPSQVTCWELLTPPKYPFGELPLPHFSPSQATCWGHVSLQNNREVPCTVCALYFMCTLTRGQHFRMC